MLTRMQDNINDIATTFIYKFVNTAYVEIFK